MAPRPARRRTKTNERNIAARVTHEREDRGWTYEELSKRMTDAGCSVAVSSLNRLERGNPPRRISVDELFAFADVFELSIFEMMEPPETYRQAYLLAWLDEYTAATDKIVLARLEALRIEETRVERTRGFTSEEVADGVRTWAAGQMADQDVARALAAFVTGESNVSPYASAITGSATSVPGAINILE
jgi:transcriptional regulator with XRE-family HTH domain